MVKKVSTWDGPARFRYDCVQAMAKRGIPVTWHDSAHPENLRFVEESEGGQFGIAGRREGNLKAKTKNVPEMFAFANIDSLDPDEVSSWANSRGAWNA